MEELQKEVRELAEKVGRMEAALNYLSANVESVTSLFKNVETEFNEFKKETIGKVNEVNGAASVAIKMAQDIVFMLGIRAVKGAGDNVNFSLEMPSKDQGGPRGFLSRLQADVNEIKQRIGTRIIIPN